MPDASHDGPAPSPGATDNVARYTIEYLTWTQEDAAVCSVVMCDASLASAVLQARIGATTARIQHRANGFQICDGWQGGRVAARERFWGFDGRPALASS